MVVISSTLAVGVVNGLKRTLNSECDVTFCLCQVCITPECVEIAGTILRKIDMKTLPCDDFYRFSCGRWIETFNRPANKTPYTMFVNVQEKNSEKVRKVGYTM